MSAVSTRFSPDGSYDFAAGRERIAAYHAAANAKADRLNKLWAQVCIECDTEEEAIRGLHAISAGLMTTKPTIGTDIYESVELIDDTAEAIQWRYES